MSKSFVILSIDGGGIRGIIPAQVLARCEAILGEVSKDSPRVSDHFDLVAGTSTGGILACGLLVPDSFDHSDEKTTDEEETDTEEKTRSEYSAKELVGLYMDKGEKIFDNGLYQKIRSAKGWLDQKYPSAPIEEILQGYFGDLRISELVKPCLITSYDLSRRKAHFFRQHSGSNKDASDFLVRDVCRSTSAAPTFFEPSFVKSLAGIPYPLIDGGVIANNPALCALAEAMNRFHVKLEDIFMLSIGTGSFKQPYDHVLAKDWGTAQWILPLIDILMSGVAETAHFQVNELFESIGHKANYLRIDTEFRGDNPLHPEPDLDDARPENTEKLKNFGRELADENEEGLRNFLKAIIKSKAS